MKLKTKIEPIKLKSSKLQIELLSSGDIYQIVDDEIQINLLKGNLLDGAVSNIYLRSNKKGNYEFAPLLGVKSASSFAVDKKQVIYQGKTLGVNYQVVLTLAADTWYYDVLLDSVSKDCSYELFYCQDVALAPKAMTSNNEAYTGQYVDHKIFDSENGYLVLSRQNQNIPNLLQLGSFNKITSYSTDGFQFFGLIYKKTNTPQALLKKQLENKNYQYEFPYVALKTEQFKLDRKKVFTFYGKYVRDYKTIRDKPFVVERKQPLAEFISGLNLKRLQPQVSFGEPLVGEDLTIEELQNDYQNIRYLEKEQDQILAFFADPHIHVVTNHKELLVERAHAHIQIHGNLIAASENVMTVTNFMFGVFASHVALGNTNFHKLSGDLRNHLNVQKLAGMRIYLKVANNYRLLTLPSLFEISTNCVKWVYKLADDVIEIKYLSDINRLQQKLVVKSLTNKTYDLLVTQPIIVGELENQYSVDFKLSHNAIEFTAKNNPLIMANYPNLKYKYISEEDVIITDDSYFFGPLAQEGMVIFKYQAKSEINLNLIASLTADYEQFNKTSCDALQEKSNQFFSEIVPLKINSSEKKIKSLNELSFWYTHNALVHYASPHGIEQPNGAAWGTRDICQGPFELFMTAQKYEIVRKLLLKVFSRQFYENGDFPQWFMYDKYYQIQAHESHGDIIVWPLKALASYILKTGDTTILQEEVPFMSLEQNDFTKEKATLIVHLEKLLAKINQSKIKSIDLPAYGGGDWNDTLQPANQELTEKMVSTWTVSLIYEALTKLYRVLPEKYQSLRQKIFALFNTLKENYYKYLIVDGVPTGFTVFLADKRKVLIHPQDKSTNLKYRLLSFNRGFISELFPPEKTAFYYQIINQHLKHPDGVRLIDKAIKYHGGKNTYFMRAETAANFGREVGLNYTHAHLRYIEAMAKIGQCDEVLNGLVVINPILIKKHVKNAMYRQSNTYFSSSDGNFYDRYIAQKEFDLLRTGEVKVKAGWRIYSSGPGIYLNQLLSNFLGVKIENKTLILDPCVDKNLKYLEFEYQFLGKKLLIKYHFSVEDKLLINSQEKPIIYRKNKYKRPSLIINSEDLKQAKNEIVVFLKS